MSSEYTEPTPTFAIITCSDTRTLETDTAGAALKELIAERGWVCLEHVVVEDERPFISGALLHAIEDLHADFVLTCGGSGGGLDGSLAGYGGIRGVRQSASDSAGKL